MVRPELCTRVEERHLFVGLWISGLSLSTFEFIAATAGEPQVVFNSRATARQWKNMVNSH
jgi:hypothetical protein